MNEKRVLRDGLGWKVLNRSVGSYEGRKEVTTLDPLAPAL